MEAYNIDANDSTLFSFYHPQLRHQTYTPSPAAAAVTPTDNTGGILYRRYSAVSSPLETVKRKRGRPRKYGTLQKATSAKRFSASSAVFSAASSSVTPGSSGNVGQSFSPHIITVASGEDVNQKIMMFMQQCQEEVCIISASGSVSKASLIQPATSRGCVTYVGQFDIISLSGSFIHTENGEKTGELGVWLSSSNGQIIGGGICGPVTAASPIRIIVGTFLIDTKKDIKGSGSSGKLPSPAGVTPRSDLNFLSPVAPTLQMMGGGLQHPRMQLIPSHSMEWRGNTGLDIPTMTPFPLR